MCFAAWTPSCWCCMRRATCIALNGCRRLQLHAQVPEPVAAVELEAVAGAPADEAPPAEAGAPGAADLPAPAMEEAAAPDAAGDAFQKAQMALTAVHEAAAELLAVVPALAQDGGRTVRPYLLFLMLRAT